MKKLILLSLMLLAFFYGQAQESIESEIKSVKVFTRGAEVFRSAKVKLKKGKNEIKISKLSANLDSKTIQVSGNNFTILSVRHSPDYIENENTPDEINVLVLEKERFLDSIALLDVQLKILGHEHTMLFTNMDLIGDDGIKNQDFQEAVSYFNEKFKSITHEQFEKRNLKKTLAKRIIKLEKQISANAGKEKEPSSNIFLTLESETEHEVDLQVTYSISEAGWFPSYDIRALNTNSPIALTYKARVYQNSGVDWKNVKLSISSGDLESSGTAPSLSPYYLGFSPYNYNNFDQSISHVSGRVVDETGQGLPRVTVMVKGSTQGVSTGPSGYYDLQIPTGGASLIYRYLGYTQEEIPVSQEVMNLSMQPELVELDEIVTSADGINDKPKTDVARLLRGKVSGVDIANSSGIAGSGTNIIIRGYSSIGANNYQYKPEEKTIPLEISQINYQTTFVYDIKVPYDIPSTGEPQVVNMLTKELETDYIYYAAPKLKEQAFLVAKVSNWTELNLIDGESNLYFENSFVGKSIIDTNVGMDTLNLSLGKDEGIIVNRERLRDFEENKFLSNKKREERHWLITVVNTKSESINLSLNDQIPMTIKSNLKVGVLDISGAKLEKESGLLTWNLKLAPGEKKELRVRYYVEQPKYSNIIVN